MAAYNCVNCMVYIRGSTNYASLFAQMFPDSEIALRFQVQKDENPYAVIYGLGSFPQKQRYATVQKCSFSRFRSTKA